MSRQRVTIKEVDSDCWLMMKQLRDEERRFMGAIISDAIRGYWETIFESDEDQECEGD